MLSNFYFTLNLITLKKKSVSKMTISICLIIFNDRLKISFTAHKKHLGSQQIHRFSCVTELR